MLPHKLLSQVMRLPAKCPGVFLYVWERTVSFRMFHVKLDVREIMNAVDTSRSTVQRSAAWLSENGWLDVEEHAGENNTYGISEKLLEEHGCLVSDTPVKNDRGQEQIPPHTPPIRILSLVLDPVKEKEPKPNVNIVTTGEKPENDHDQVSGASVQIVGFEHLSMVRDMLSYGVNKNLIVKAITENGEDWVRRIYREFNTDVQLAHNMRSPSGVLASRLKDSDESWRSQPMEQTYMIPPGLVDKWQAKIDLQFVHPEGNPKAVRSIIADFAKEAEVPFRLILAEVDTHGVEVLVA